MFLTKLGNRFMQGWMKWTKLLSKPSTCFFEMGEVYKIGAE